MLLKISCWTAVIAVSLFGLKQFSNGGVCENQNRMDGKVVLITGGNSGLGKETAMVLAERGAKVYITCRRESSGQEAVEEIRNLTGLAVTSLILDLASKKSIRRFAKDFKSREPTLDVLINNAGVFFLSGKTEDGFELGFGVNHLGHFLLTNLLIDEIIKSKDGRIINLSSNYHEKGYMNWDDINNEYSNMSLVELYGQSKTASILFTTELAKRLNGTSVSAYSVHPGTIITNIVRNLYIFKEKSVAHWLLYIVTWPFVKELNAGVQTTVCCATDDHLVSGKYYVDCLEKEPGPQARSEIDASRLWNLSIEMLKMSESYIHDKLR